MTKKIVYILLSICIIIGIALLTLYLIHFKGNLSNIQNDWGVFCNIFNLIIASINLLLFYILTTKIEDNTNFRHVKDKIFAAQSTLTEIRFQKYNNLCSVIYQIRNELFSDGFDFSKLNVLRFSLINEIDSSLFFVNDNNENYFNPLIEEICSLIDKIQKENGNISLKENMLKNTFILVNILEIFIIGQQVRDNETVKYMDKEGMGQIDSTISSINKLTLKFEELLKERAEDNI